MRLITFLPASNFNPRSPDGERRAMRVITFLPASTFNPRSRVGVRPPTALHHAQTWTISIHAPGLGCDHQPHFTTLKLGRFQSTLPGWGATTACHAARLRPGLFQSTLPGWGATPAVWVSIIATLLFQSTLPGWGATTRHSLTRTLVYIFQSTLPGWGATDPAQQRQLRRNITIHAPRMGCDRPRATATTTTKYYNPRSPDGVRQTPRNSDNYDEIFQSTLPGWGATDPAQQRQLRRNISIHAPRMGSDVNWAQWTPNTSLFQSTLPGGGATFLDACRYPPIDISIHAPRMGSDCGRVRHR